MDGITWEQFLCDIKNIHDISQQLNDTWEIISKNDDIGGTYLMKTQTLSLIIAESPKQSNDEHADIFQFEEESHLAFESPAEIVPSDLDRAQFIKFEYHVLYHISYAVPYLCFNAYKSNGSLLTLDDAWKIFNDLNPKQDNAIQRNMLNILSQMEHPVLFRPFLTLHPCRIAEVLHSLPHSHNKVLSFLSIYGPTIYLTFDLNYVKHLNPNENSKEINY